MKKHLCTTALILAILLLFAAAFTGCSDANNTVSEVSSGNISKADVSTEEISEEDISTNDVLPLFHHR